MNLRESPPLRLGLRPSHLSPVNGGEDTPAARLAPFLAPTKWGIAHRLEHFHDSF